MIQNGSSSGPINPSSPSRKVIGPQEVRRYYYKLIVQEFRDLQLDQHLKNKSVFDLIDYCEILYEKSAHCVNGNEDSLKNYIRGYLIFNYFINSFIMLHFKGFDQFIKTNEYDFIIYLNVFAFYNTDDHVDNSAYSIPLPDLRALVLAFLADRALLKFDVDDLYQWLYEYIEYLKKKDQFQKEISEGVASEDAGSGEVDSMDSRVSYTQQNQVDVSEGSDLQEITKEQYQSGIIQSYDSDSDSDDSNIYTETLVKSRKSYSLTSRLEKVNLNSSDESINYHSDGSITNFQDRFPSIKLKPEPVSFDKSTESFADTQIQSKPHPPKVSSQSHIQSQNHASKEHFTTRPPIPSQLPPGLPLIESMSSPNIATRTDTKAEKRKSNTPYPVKTLVEETPYPIGKNISTDNIVLDGQSFVKPPLNTSQTDSSLQTYNRTKQSVPFEMVPKLPSRMSMSGPIPVQQMPHLHPQNQQYTPQYANQYPPPQQYPQHQQYPQYQQFNMGPPPMASPPQAPGPPMNGGYSNGYQSGPYQQNYQQPQNPQQQQYEEYARQKQMKVAYMKDYSICGLKNFGSSCYVNSTIQLLFGVEEFKALFTHSQYNKYIRDPRFVAAKKNNQNNSKDTVLLSEAVSGLLKSFAMHGGASIAPTKFIRISSLLKPDLNIPYEQQDSQEFLLFVLDRLHEELSAKSDDELNVLVFESYMRMWGINIPTDDLEGYFKWYKSLIEFEGSSPIHDLFEGHLQSKLICNKCKHQSISYSQFTILSLPIPSRSRYGSSGPIDISDCLRYYTQDEVLSGENAWKCPNCHKESGTNGTNGALDNHPVFTKKPGIFKLSRRSKSPVKESKKDKKDKKKQAQLLASGNATKKLNFIKLPRILFIHLSRFSMFNLTDKLDTMISYPLELNFGGHHSVITYRLSGLINHYGNLKSGHYTSLVNKSGNGGYWCYFDDETVRLNVDHVNKQYKASSRDVYVLCYERVE